MAKAVFCIAYCAKTPPTENHSKIERLIVL